MSEKKAVLRQVVDTFKEKTDFEKGLVIGLMINEEVWKPEQSKEDAPPALQDQK